MMVVEDTAGVASKGWTMSLPEGDGSMEESEVRPHQIHVSENSLAAVGTMNGKGETEQGVQCRELGLNLDNK